ncbi:MAG: CPXCG motif-containing cysteine-rich protein [Kofleriaceae bacterium]|jgi:hypothetical protein|nr:CPXCG motif-containing cysteine-rich protein [Kofleriaceae bacterium]MBP9204806.1 CPXCG motif-containing cysteine-rich protein [Kofleriaceae bacterium]
MLPRRALPAGRLDRAHRSTCPFPAPYCREWVELYVDPDSTGVMVEDCAVCCRPWTVAVERAGGRTKVRIERAQ